MYIYLINELIRSQSTSSETESGPEFWNSPSFNFWLNLDEIDV